MRSWALLGVCAAIACGGQVSGSPDAGGDAHASSSGSSSSGGTTGSSSGTASGSGGSGGGSGGPVDLCPPDPPTAGVTCVSAGLGCAYPIGGQCEGYRCTGGGTWQMDPTVTCP